MNIQLAKSMSYEEIRAKYKEYLKSCGFAQSTIQTSYNDSFYLWNKSGADVFWRVVTDSNFEDIAKKELLNDLIENTTGDPNKLVNGYMSHLRRLLKFIETTPEVSAEIKKDKIFRNEKKTDNVPLPCSEQLEYYLKQWDKLENYRLQEDALDKLFNELCPENKAIYDSYVEKMLLYFKKKDNFDDFVAVELKNYSRFKAILISFGEFYGLNEYNLKDIDKYIWQMGKEYFPKSYGKKKNV